MSKNQRGRVFLEMVFGDIFIRSRISQVLGVQEISVDFVGVGKGETVDVFFWYGGFFSVIGFFWMEYYCLVYIYFLKGFFCGDEFLVKEVIQINVIFLFFV